MICQLDRVCRMLLQIAVLAHGCSRLCGDTSTPGLTAAWPRITQREPPRTPASRSKNLEIRGFDRSRFSFPPDRGEVPELPRRGIPGRADAYRANRALPFRGFGLRTRSAGCGAKRYVYIYIYIYIYINIYIYIYI